MNFKKIAIQLMGKSCYSFCRWTYHNFGIFFIPLHIIKFISNQQVVSIKNPLDSKKRLYLRPGTTDMDVYNEIFVNREFDFNFDHPKLIIDAGAHVGFSIIWFSQKYPESTIIAIEPEKSNFNMLEKNCQYYNNVITLNYGLWNKETNLYIENYKDNNWNFIVKETEKKTDIPAISLNKIIDDYKLDRIDILKMDIEGSEVEVLNSSSDWIEKVENLIIELHDRFRPGCTEALEKVLTTGFFEYSALGEKVFLGRK